VNHQPTIRPSALLGSIVLGVMVLLFGAGKGAGAARGAEPVTVVVLQANGVVDQVMAGYLSEGITAAAASGAPAVVIELDTPGGSMDAMRDIFQAELNAALPVIVWVAPSGARAASAGTFITLAAHVDAMASGTNIGAASPISSDGSDIPGTLGQKVRNDAIASITAIAEQRGRPVDWAVSTVANATSYTVDQAVSAGAVDIKADSLSELLTQADGRVVSVRGQPWTIRTAGAPTEQQEPGLLQGFLHVLADPNIAAVLFTLGLFGLMLELVHPNLTTGILGAFALILAFIGFGSLPLNIGGLLLIALAVVLVILELTITSHGLLAIGAIVAFVLGATALYTVPSTPVDAIVAVAWPVIVVMVVLVGLLVIGLMVALRRSRHSPKVVIGGAPGTAQMLATGTLGEVRGELVPLGTVYAAGEEWSARSADGTAIESDAPIRVIGQEGLTLVVARAHR
jgi:membrane-bound serine protease (ClpP class)